MFLIVDFSSLLTSYIYKKCEKGTCQRQKLPFSIFKDKETIVTI
jgi:hypothetical protein